MSRAGRPELVADREDDGELRQLTVMFCDLVDSTRLSQTLDPEDLRRVIQEYQHACTGLVRELEGYVAQLLGDGMLVYFGYPHAHEDDPIRALSAALVILESLPELNARLVSAIPCLREHPLSIRIGIHTGSVVVARMGHLDRREPLAVGSAPYVAARLQALAPADSIVISDTTRRLLGDRFVLEPLGNRTLKGVEDGMSVYAVVARRDPDSDGAFGTPLDTTEPVGREQELALLLDRWEQTKERRGQAVLLRGEAGIGESRLLRMLRKRLANDPHTWLEGHCSIYHENSAFRPIAEILAQTLQFGRPVVASDLPGYRVPLRDGASGRLVPPARPAALAEALGEILARPDLAKRMSARARATALEYDWHRVAEALQRCYETVVRQPRVYATDGIGR